jgi:phosphate/sulfate permease
MVQITTPHPGRGPRVCLTQAEAVDCGIHSAFLVAQAAITLGYPISFNKVMISSIVGAGLVGGSSDSDGVSTTKTVYTVGAWVGSMLGGAVISFALYHTLAALPGLG